VSFSYPGNDRAILRDVCLDVARGETLVLTGATGAGKTTLLQLVPRLADVTSGRVLLDGTDVRDIALPELRAAVACAFEEATLFSASVRENVTFGAADATEEEIEAALTAAQARFAYDLPWGLDTRIGEQGMALSGGQRQRVALARAILSRPEVLILDDPLSALDVQTEERVTTALRQILAGVTALVVAHRPSTVALADRVARGPPRPRGQRRIRQRRNRTRPTGNGGLGPAPRPGGASRPRPWTRCPRRLRRCCGNGAGGCSATCCGRTGRLSGSRPRRSSSRRWPRSPGRG
jgi:ATP-binding cassette subfamily B protein